MFLATLQHYQQTPVAREPVVLSKIYCDIADIKFIKKFNKKKIVKGFTTNPSLIRKAGAKNYEDYSKNILKTCKSKPISFEVFGKIL